MEEEKAAEYYNELLRKGGNAAKFKQGLGFGAQDTSVSNRTSDSKEGKYLSLNNFVKGSGTGNAATLDEEIRIERIVEKLKKPRSSTPTYPQGVGEKSLDVTNSKEHVGGKTPYSYESGERVKEEPGRSRRSAPADETERAPLRKPSSRERRGRSRERSRISGRKFSRSSSDTNSSKSPTKRRKRSTRRGSDESPSSIDDNRSRHGRKTSSSYKGAHRQGRDYSPHEIRRKERSRSPPSHRNAYNHTENKSTGRSGSERERERDRRHERPSVRHRDGRNGATDSSHSSRAKEKAPERDYSKLRLNVDTMTPGDKFKAKTKVQFPDTVMNDPTMGTSNGWERFDFDKNAPLDDDAKLDYFGDSTGAGDDTLFLKNTASSYLSSHSQVKREALATAKHEASIFGVPEDPSLKKSEPARDPRESPPRNLGIVDRSISDEERDCEIETPSMNSVLSEQVLAMQKAGSWQDRAQKMRKARVNLQ